MLVLVLEMVMAMEMEPERRSERGQKGDEFCCFCFVLFSFSLASYPTFVKYNTIQ